MPQASNRFYYGWVIVTIAFVSALLTTCSTIYAFGLYTHPVSQEFGLSRSDFNRSFILYSIGSGVLSPIVGNLLDRMSVRWIMAIGALLLGGSQIVLSQSTSLLLDAIVIVGPLTLGFVMCGTLSGYVLVARWFGARRGRAMAIAALGQSASGILGTPVIAALLQHLGWRPSLLIVGAIVATVLFVLALFVRERPAVGQGDAPLVQNRAQAVAVEADDAVWGYGRLLRSGRFWSLFAAVSMIMGAVSSLMVTLVPYGIEQGLTPVVAATLISLVGLSGVVAKFGLALIADRFARSTLLAIGAVTLAVFCFVLLLTPPYVALAATCAIAGFAIGTSYPLVAAIVADRFGTRSYGTAMGLMAPGIAFSTAAASAFIGVVFDRTGNYTVALATFMALLVASALVLLYSDRRLRIVPASGLAPA